MATNTQAIKQTENIMKTLSPTEYRAQTNTWNSYVKYSRDANAQFVGASTKAKFSAMAETAYDEYVQAGGTNSKTSMFSMFSI